MKSLVTVELFATAWISATWKKLSPSLDFAEMSSFSLWCAGASSEIFSCVQIL